MSKPATVAVMLASIVGVFFGSADSCGGGSGSGHVPTNGHDPYFAARVRMVDQQIRARGVKDPAVIDAMLQVPRHLFVPPESESSAYEDMPLPIGRGQTISQPYIVGLMTELLQPRAGQKILEVGTGSGYQAAVLSTIVGEVYSIEILEPLAEESRQRLASLGYGNVVVRAGDGYRGWPDAAPFDGIIVTAAPGHVPQPLIDQLKMGGRLVIPVGETAQDLVLITRTPTGIVRENILGVRFVPMTGEAAEGREP